MDPACGSGNFLYVTLEHLKRLEGEVLNALDELDYRQTGLALDGERADAAAGETVDPHNLLGIELNPRAAAIAEVVLWIGYLQWHYRTRGDVHPPQPVIRDFRNIENRDAVLAYDRVEWVTDEHGVPVTRWDGDTMKASPVTGEPVPDESARKPVEKYVNPRKAAWPEADFVVGNPPFIGNKRMRAALGDGYVEALRSVWEQVPESADFVMYWWHYAALLARRGALERFGLITTNGIRQAFNRQVLSKHMSSPDSPLSLVFVVPDHPWVDSQDGAQVRIAMTAAAAGSFNGILSTVDAEIPGANDELDVVLKRQRGRIFVDLRTGVDVASAGPLTSNVGLASRGVTLVGQGFLVPDEHFTMVADAGRHLKPYLTGRVLSTGAPRPMVLDFFGFDEDEVRLRAPGAYQWIVDRVKPERAQNNRATYRDRWWVFAEPRTAFRKAAAGLPRVIVTPRTAKHRFFQFEQPIVQFESEVVGIALADPIWLGVLCSSVHMAWVEANAASFGAFVGNIRYNQTRCFDPFPFPGSLLATTVDPSTGSTTTNTATRDDQGAFCHQLVSGIRNLAEQLDAHRKRQQQAHPGLTLTGMYNVLEKLRSGEDLTPKELTFHEQGLVSVLRQLHDELDEAVLGAYGWADLAPTLRIAHGNLPPTADVSREDAKRRFEEAVLERLVALNAERAVEEARGHVRWLRPEFQNPEAERAPDQPGLSTTQAQPTAEQPTAVVPAKPTPWPKDPIDQVRAVADLLAASPIPLSTDEIAARFTARGRWKERLPKLLEMLVALGSAQEKDGTFTA
ncbi:class I SAM-dependent DNA methyltransferase [Luteimonas sp. A277]